MLSSHTSFLYPLLVEWSKSHQRKKKYTIHCNWWREREREGNMVWLQFTASWILLVPPSRMGATKKVKNAKGPLYNSQFQVIIHLWKHNCDYYIKFLLLNSPTSYTLDLYVHWPWNYSRLLRWTNFYYSHNRPFSQQTFDLAGKARAKVISLTMAQFHQVSQ